LGLVGASHMIFRLINKFLNAAMVSFIEGVA
jgi:hypothetical protein